VHAFLVAVVIAQQIIPASPLISGGLADPREPRSAVGFLITNLFADELHARPAQGFPSRDTLDLKSDTHGVVELGINFPLVQIGQVTASLQGGVTSRFRLESKDNDALSTDYMIALPFNYVRGAYGGRVRLIHRSSHLGDELVQNTSIRRLEFDHEEIDALLERRFGSVRGYVGGTLTLASSFEHDKRGVQVGADGQWRLGRNLKGVGGIQWERHTITQGSSRVSAAAGLTVRGPGGTATLEARYLNGATPVGEFFLDRETFWGLRLVLGTVNREPRTVDDG
jgi:hypothetical protein